MPSQCRVAGLLDINNRRIFSNQNRILHLLIRLYFSKYKYSHLIFMGALTEMGGQMAPVSTIVNSPPCARTTRDARSSSSHVRASTPALVVPARVSTGARSSHPDNASPNASPNINPVLKW